MKLKKLKEQAKDNNTNPNILAKLANNKDKSIRRYVAGNPNTPIEVLEILGADFPEVVIENPIFDWLLPNNVSSYFVRLSLARSSKTKRDVLTKMADFDLLTVKDLEIIYAIAKHQHTPIEVLEKLLVWSPSYTFFDLNIFYGAEYSYFRIKNKIEYLVAKNRNTPSYLLAQLADRHSKNIDRSIPSNGLYPQTEERLKNGINFKILRAIANHKNTSTEILEYLAGENDALIHQIILKHPNVSPKAIDIIKFRQGKFKKEAYFLKELALDNRKQVRALVASHQDTSISIVTLLARDRELFILLAILERKYIPTAILEELAKQSNKRIHKAILKHPNVSHKAIKIIQLMRSRSPVIIDNSILEELSNDERVKVRKKVVQNKFTPSYILDKLTRDCDRYIQNKAISALKARDTLQ